MFGFLSKSPPWDEVNYWALDLETGGLQPADPILSLGMVPLRGGVICFGEHFYTLVRPKNFETLSTEGIRAHQIVPAELEQAPPLAHAIAEFEARVGPQDVLLLHFAQVDVGFLKRAFGELGKPWPRHRVVDTAVLLANLTRRTRQLEPYARALPAGLGEARAALSLPGHLEHHALWDALATAELFLVLRARLGARTLQALQ
ncbi:MAG: 3'-5' exonuclease [Meiothermus sp.]|nr:3'-5' exonuclease [Meiothermus sp.]